MLKKKNRRSETESERLRVRERRGTAWVAKGKAKTAMCLDSGIMDLIMSLLWKLLWSVEIDARVFQSQVYSEWSGIRRWLVEEVVI